MLRRAWAVQPRDRILDVGCGAGQTTREAARMAPAGSALGVDVSVAAVERAGERARAEGLRNVAFECADAQVHTFAQGAFDLAISRFGTMFFADPVAAFGNIGRALRPGGRLVMMVWQAAERNEWTVAIRKALGTAPPGNGPNAFSLADPPAVERILGSAGFADVTLTDVDEPVYYGPDPQAALEWVRGFAAAQDGGLERLRDMLAARMSDDGVWFGSRAWIVSARRSAARE